MIRPPATLFAPGAPLAALDAHAQFICWRLENRPGQEKPAKVPFNPRTGNRIDAQDATAWLSWRDALDLAERHHCGVGFVISEADPFVFIDVDGQWDANAGAWSESAQRIYSQFPGAYFEISQSGDGFHLIGTGQPGEHKSRGAGLEFYSRGRFVALTGTQAQGDAGTDLTAALPQFLADYGLVNTGNAKAGDAEWTAGPLPEWAGPADDDTLIEKMRRARLSAAAAFGDAATFAQLWEADAEALGRAFPHPDKAYDASAADMALCGRLAWWTGKDCERMDRMFRQSGLYREKWERDDYRTATILRAVAGTSDCYTGAPSSTENLPHGFSVDKGGVRYTEEGGDPTWICSPLHVTAQTRSDKSESWGRLLEFQDSDGTLHRWPCPVELLAGDGTDFRRTLLSMGLHIAPGSKARALLATYVQACRTSSRATCTPRTGWYGGAYVLPDETIGESGCERVILQTLAEPPAMQRAGTWEGWRDRVAAPCAENSRLVLSVSLAFAGPLLHFTGDGSGGINLVGASSTGKTTALRVAASVWGAPDALKTWRATTNGLEGTAVLHNDNLLILDKLAEIDPREAGAAAYMLANGGGKSRARKDGLARPSAQWRLLFLSSGEVGLAEHMREADKRARAGQEVRLADVPADAGCGLGLFENTGDAPNGAAFAGRLLDAARANHGLVGRTFLQRLIEMPGDDIRGHTVHVRQQFAMEALPADADGQARRVADRFALAACGGELATRFGLTGWAEGEAITAAQTCFGAWLERRGGAGSQEAAQALSQVRHFLEVHGEARFALLREDAEPSLRVSSAKRAGYRRMMNSRLQYLILPEVFKTEVCEGLDYRFVLNLLRDHGRLHTEEFDRLTVKPRGVGRAYAIWGYEDE